MGDQGLMYSGGENAYPFNTIAAPAPRGHVPQMQNKKQGEASAGFMLMKPLVETATAAGRAVAVRRAGAVPGRRVRRPGRRHPRPPIRHDVTIRARRGVVLATGSFAYNDSMVARFAPRIAGRPAASIEQHDGQAIRMAQALGADLAHMDATEVAIFIDPQQLVRGILVNARGQRYVAEDTYPGRVGQLTLYHQDNTAYLIIDGDAQEEAMASQSPQADAATADLGVRVGGRAGGARWACRPEACKPPSPPTTRARPAARIRCCTRSREWLRADRLARRRHRSARKHRRVHPGRAAHHAGRRGAARQRRADPRPVRRGPVDRGPGRLGLRQRHLAGRRQLLRPPRRQHAPPRSEPFFVSATARVCSSPRPAAFAHVHAARLQVLDQF